MLCAGSVLEIHLSMDSALTVSFFFVRVVTFPGSQQENKIGFLGILLGYSKKYT